MKQLDQLALVAALTREADVMEIDNMNQMAHLILAIERLCSV